MYIYSYTCIYTYMYIYSYMHIYIFIYMYIGAFEYAARRSAAARSAKGSPQSRMEGISCTRWPRASRTKILVQPSHKAIVMAASRLLAR